MGIFHLRLAILVACGYLAGCATEFSVRHSPIYQVGPHIATVTAKARSSGGVSAIDIFVNTGTMTNCTELGLLPSAIPCVTQLVPTNHRCNFAGNPTSVQCDFGINPQDGTLVTYYAAVEVANGGRYYTGSITFAGGTPVPITSVVGSSTIHWETARPVWWHADWPCSACNTSPFSNSAQAAQGKDHMQVFFYPAADIPNPLAFSAAVSSVVEQSFFNEVDPYAQTYTAFSHAFDLWAGSVGFDAVPDPAAKSDPKCIASFAAPAKVLQGMVSGSAVILHAKECRDVAALSLNSSTATATVWTNPPAFDAPAGYFFTHESGHLLHGLADEYGCDGGYSSISDPNSVFDSLATCQLAADAASLDKTLCTRITDASTGAFCSTAKWAMNDGQLAIMRDRSAASDWRTLSRTAVQKRVAQCLLGICY